MTRWPEAVKKEVQTFADVNVAWLSKVLSAAAVVNSEESEQRARAIFAAVAGAQLMARSRSDISLFDSLIESYRVAGLLPEQTVQSSISSDLAKKRGTIKRSSMNSERRSGTEVP